MAVSSRITCITASRDNRTILISLEEGLVQMVDLEERCVVKRYVSVEQDKHIIRNCFGGAAENFVLSGSKGQFAQWPWLISTDGCRRRYFRLAQGQPTTDRKTVWTRQGTKSRGPCRYVHDQCVVAPQGRWHVRFGWGRQKGPHLGEHRRG